MAHKVSTVWLFPSLQCTFHVIWYHIPNNDGVLQTTHHLSTHICCTHSQACLLFGLGTVPQCYSPQNPLFLFIPSPPSHSLVLQFEGFFWKVGPTHPNMYKTILAQELSVGWLHTPYQGSILFLHVGNVWLICKVVAALPLSSSTTTHSSHSTLQTFYPANNAFTRSSKHYYI